VDQKWRDLPGVAAIAVALADEFGLSSELVAYPLWRHALTTCRPQAIAVTHMNGGRNRAIARAAHAMGVRVIVVPTEGRPPNAEAMDYSFGSGSDNHAVDLWFTWSREVQEYMQDRGVPAERSIVAGVPRFDLYRAPLDSLIVTRPDFARAHGLDPDRPIISWATNFTHAKFNFRHQDFLVNNWRTLGLQKFPIYSQPLEYARKDHEARQRNLEALGQLLRARSEIQIAFKPHPHEEHEEYAGFIARARQQFGPRIALVTSRYIWDLLAAADLHVHRMCTTGIEAWFLDKPTINLQLLDYFDMSLKVEGAGADAAAGDELALDGEALIDAVDRGLQQRSPAPERLAARERYIERWFHVIDGSRSRAYAAGIAQLLAHRCVIRAARHDVASLKAMTTVAVNRLLGRPLHQSLRSWRASPSADALGQVDNYVAAPDVNEWIAKIRTARHGAGRPSIPVSGRPQ
jgi:surface carbohydrate biosynthesis protein